MELYQDWEDKTKNVSTSFLTMSVGELIRLYTKDQLKINPAYQRHYRWNNQDKSNFIESLILGYPIPPIFTYRNDKNSEYEIIDGLQRLATIFEFTGKLKSNIKPKENLSNLSKTNIMESLIGKTWDDFCEVGLDFVLESRPLQITVLDNRNELKTKYEIFRRLNSSSVTLSSQEIRNATLFELNGEEYVNIDNNMLEMKFSFLSAQDRVERKDMELFLEFILIGKIINNELSEEMKKKLKEETYSIILDEFSFQLKGASLKHEFKMFQDFYIQVKKYQFKYYDKAKNKSSGQFINAYFEILAAIYFYDKDKLSENNILDILSLKYNKWLNIIHKRNPNAKTRMISAIEYAKTLYGITQ